MKIKRCRTAVFLALGTLVLSLSGVIQTMQDVTVLAPGGSRTRERPPIQSESETSRHLAEGPRASKPATVREGTNQLPQGKGSHAWAIPYGREFWRQPTAATHQRQQDSARPNLDLGDITERVSHAIARDGNGGTPVVQARSYTAKWDDQALRISLRPDAVPGEGWYEAAIEDVASPTVPAPPAQVEFNFRTLTIRQNGETLNDPASGHRNWSITGNTIQALLSAQLGLVEHHEARRDGVEISWVISRPLQSTSPLTIETAYAGADYRGESRNGYCFRDETGLAWFRVGHATVVDASGKTWPLTAQVTGDRLLFEIPEVILAQATYPLAIDPVIGPEFPLDEPMGPLPALSDQDDPAVAFNGTDYLVVWVDDRFPSPIIEFTSTTGDIIGARVSAHGEVLDPVGIVISAAKGNESNPTVAALGSEFVVVWTDNRSGLASLMGARISADGTVLDAEGFFIGVGANAAIAATDHGYLVAWSADGDVYGRRLNTAGSVVEAAPFPICTVTNSQAHVAVAANGVDYLVVWEDRRQDITQGDIYGSRVTGGGVVATPNGFAISRAPNAQWHPTVASDGQDFLVVWSDHRSSLSDAHIYGARVAFNGSLLDANGFVVSGAGRKIYPAVASDGLAYFVAWTDFRGGQTNLYGARVKSTGLVLDSSGIFITMRRGQGAETTAIASSGTNFFVVWDRDTGTALSGVDVEGTFISSVGQPNSTRFVVSSSANHQESPAVAASQGQYLVVWADRRHQGEFPNVDIYGVRVDSDGSVLDPAGIAISTALNNQLSPAVASDGTNYFVVWADLRNPQNNADIYGARVLRTGAVVDLTGIPICQVTNSQAEPAVACNGRDYYVAWQDGRPPYRGTTGRIFGTRVTPAGAVSDPNGLQIGNGPSAQQTPAAAALGPTFLIVWTDARHSSTNGNDIYGARISGTGVLLDPAGLGISVSRRTQFAPSVSANGTNFLVVWQDSRNDNSLSSSTNVNIYGTRIGSNGIVLDPTGLAISLAPGNQTVPAVAAFGPDYLVVWTDQSRSQTNNYSDIFGARVTSAGLVEDPAGISININPLVQDSPAVAYGGAGRFLIVAQGVHLSTPRMVGQIATVNFPPVGQAQQVTLLEDQSINLMLSGFDANGDPLTYFVADPPAHGLLAGAAPNLTYTPAPDFFGTDTFTYRVSDGLESSAPVQVTVMVGPVNDPPRLRIGADQIILEDSGVQVREGWANELTPGPENESNQVLTVSLITDKPELFAVQPTLNALGTLHFAPALNAHGTARVTLSLNDDGGTDHGGLNTTTRTFMIRILPRNDAPTVNGQSLSVLEDTSVPITLSATDVDGDAIHFVLGPPAHGSLAGVPPHVIYIPAPDYHGPDRFFFKVSDGQTSSGVATVTLTILPTNDGPIARVGPDLMLSCNAAVAHLDGTGSTDVDDSALSFAWYEGSQLLGTDAVLDLPLALGVHSLTLAVTDASGASSTATQTITVIDDAPPQLLCPDNVIAEFADAHGAAVSFAPAASDTCGTVSVHCVPPTGTVFPIGTNAVVCVATDQATNISTCAFTITVLGARGVKQAVYDALLELRGLVREANEAARLADAIKHLSAGLTPALWRDENHLQPKHGKHSFQADKKAAKKLEELLKDHPISEMPLRDLLQRLVRANRLLAAVAIQDTWPSETGGKDFEEAVKQRAQGDVQAAAGDFEGAIQHYFKAWEKSAVIKLGRPVLFSNGRVRWKFAGEAGQIYLIQSSTNLLDWSTVRAQIADDAGLVEWEDAARPETAAQFYRVAEPDGL